MARRAGSRKAYELYHSIFHTREMDERELLEYEIRDLKERMAKLEAEFSFLTSWRRRLREVKEVVDELKKLDTEGLRNELERLRELADNFRFALSRLCLEYPKLAEEVGIAVDGLPELVPRAVAPARGGLKPRILGELRTGPKTTAELAGKLQAKGGSIYKFCRSMEMEGLLRGELVREGGRRVRRWELTEEGRRILK